MIRVVTQNQPTYQQQYLVTYLWSSVTEGDNCSSRVIDPWPNIDLPRITHFICGSSTITSIMHVIYQPFLWTIVQIGLVWV